MTRLTAIRPFLAKCEKPVGVTIQVSVGARVRRHNDGTYSVTKTDVERLSPPTVRVQDFTFKLNPYIAASDLVEQD